MPPRNNYNQYNAPQGPERKKFSAAIVDVSDLVESQARDIANHKMAESREDRNASKFKRWRTRVWKHNLFQDFYRQKEVNKAQKAILDSGNLYVGEDGARGEKEHREAMDAIIERFISEYEADTLRRDKGETKGTVQNVALNNLIKHFAADRNMTEADFNREKDTILRSVDPRFVEQKNKYADNLLQIAKEVRDNIEHGARLEDMDIDVNLTLGRAKESLHSNDNRTSFDKIWGGFKDSKFGQAVGNEAFLSLAGAAVYSAGKFFGKKALRSTGAKIATFGGAAVASGAVAGLNENLRLKRERSQHIRERAKGMVFDEDDMERRREMELYRYETKNAQDMIPALKRDLERISSGRLNAQELREASQNVADLEARIQLGDRQKIDLIAYSRYDKVEKERTELDLLRARIKKELRGIGAYDTVLNNLITEHTHNLVEGESGISKKDADFNTMKRNKSWMKGVKTALFGGVIGLGVQEVVHMFPTNTDGLVSDAVKHLRHIGHKPGEDIGLHKETTVLDSLFRRFEEGPRMPMGHGQELLEGHTNMHFPDSSSLIKNGDGTWNIMRDGNTIGDHLSLHFNANGDLDDTTKEMLAKHNIFTDFANTQFHGTPSEYLKLHPDGTVGAHFHHMDNDTPMYWENGHHLGADYNEKLVSWGGEHGMGVNANGDYVFNVHMMDDGSWHGMTEVHAHEEMLKGNMKMLFSLSRDTQHQVFHLDVGPDGNVIVPKDSNIAKLMFTTDDHGHAVFLGKFAQVGVKMGTDDAGKWNMDILATHVGDGVEHMNIDQPNVTFGLPDDSDIDLPPFLWVNARQPLERGKNPEPNVESPYWYGYGYGYGYGEGHPLKRHYTNLDNFRNTPETVAQLETSLRSNPVLLAKYKHVFDRLDDLRNYNSLPPNKKDPILRARERYNKRYRKNLSESEFVELEIKRINRQFENIAIEEAAIGGKPFEKKFYENSLLLKGIERAEEITIVLDNPIGDAVLMVPMVDAMYRYLKKNKLKKNIIVLTNHTGKELLGSLENQYKGIKLFEMDEGEKYFKANKKERYIINANKHFEDYEKIGISEEESKDLSRVMSVDWHNWQLEEFPDKPGHIIKYDMMPARIARNFEIMLGERIYADINKTSYYLNRSKNFKLESAELKTKYNILPGEKVFLISPGSSVMPKEYQPEKWEEVIRGLIKDNPDAHFLILDVPGRSGRSLSSGGALVPSSSSAYGSDYGAMADKLKSEGVNINRVNEGLSKMNTLMSMSDVVMSPDTGLGHFAGALGKPNVILSSFEDPVQWSSPGAFRIMHPKSIRSFGSRGGTYNPMWNPKYANSYFTDDNGEMVGASDVDPQLIIDRVNMIMAAKKAGAPVKKTKTSASVAPTGTTAPVASGSVPAAIPAGSFYATSPRVPYTTLQLEKVMNGLTPAEQAVLKSKEAAELNPGDIVYSKNSGGVYEIVSTDVATGEVTLRIPGSRIKGFKEKTTVGNIYLAKDIKDIEDARSAASTATPTPVVVATPAAPVAAATPVMPVTPVAAATPAPAVSAPKISNIPTPEFVALAQSMNTSEKKSYGKKAGDLKAGDTIYSVSRNGFYEVVSVRSSDNSIRMKIPGDAGMGFREPVVRENIFLKDDIDKLEDRRKATAAMIASATPVPAVTSATPRLTPLHNPDTAMENFFNTVTDDELRSLKYRKSSELKAGDIVYSTRLNSTMEFVEVDPKDTNRVKLKVPGDTSTRTIFTMALGPRKDKSEKLGNLYLVKDIEDLETKRKGVATAAATASTTKVVTSTPVTGSGTVTKTPAKPAGKTPVTTGLRAAYSTASTTAPAALESSVVSGFISGLKSGDLPKRSFDDAEIKTGSFIWSDKLNNYYYVQEKNNSRMLLTANKGSGFPVPLSKKDVGDIYLMSDVQKLYESKNSAPAPTIEKISYEDFLDKVDDVVDQALESRNDKNSFEDMVPKWDNDVLQVDLKFKTEGGRSFKKTVRFSADNAGELHMDIVPDKLKIKFELPDFLPALKNVLGKGKNISGIKFDTDNMEISSQ